MFNILQEVQRSHPILVSRKFKMPGCLWYGVKRTKSIVYMQLRGIVEAFFPQVVLISSLKTISSSNSVMVLLLWGCDRCVETRVDKLLSINYKNYKQNRTIYYPTF